MEIFMCTLTNNMKPVYSNHPKGGLLMDTEVKTMVQALLESGL